MSLPQHLSDLLSAAAAQAAAEAERHADAPAPMRVVRPGEDEKARRVAAYRAALHGAGIHERFAAVRMQDLRQGQDEAYARLAASVGRWAASGGRLEDKTGRLRTGVLLTGSFGVGKTALATAAFKEILWHTAKPGLWRKTYAALRYVQAGYGAGTADERLRDLQTTPCLLLDDIGDVENAGETDDRARLLYEVLDTRSDRMLPTVLTSNLDPEGLAALLGTRTGERVLEMCVHVPMAGDNRRRTNPTA